MKGSVGTRANPAQANRRALFKNLIFVISIDF
jgi:hypothetical protein